MLIKYGIWNTEILRVVAHLIFHQLLDPIAEDPGSFMVEQFQTLF